ncbi:MAG: ATP-binding protein, partial [Campylobacteraceae bacterium]|nr:ATP-binding protein [Campylobacteraceae bacterium]
MQESPKLFYLGRKEDGTEVLYKNRDLTTHALIIGMTGSGKTG